MFDTPLGLLHRRLSIWLLYLHLLVRSLGGRGAIFLIERHFRVYRRIWLAMASGALEPLFYLLSIGIGLGSLVGNVSGPSGTYISYPEFVAPGLLAVSSMNGAMSDSTFSILVRIRYTSFYDSVLATSVQPPEVALGEIGWALLRASFYAISFLAVMAVMGLTPSWWSVLDLPVAMLVGFAFAAMGLTATTYMKSWQDSGYIILITMPLFLFSATIYPLSVYPAVVRSIVTWTPLYQGVVLLRDFTTGFVSPHIIWRAVYLAVVGMAGLYWSGRRFEKLLMV